MEIKLSRMSPEKRKKIDFDNRRRGLISKANNLLLEIREEKERALRNDPELMKLYRKIEELERAEQKLRLEVRKREFDSLSAKEKEIYTTIGWNPYETESRVIYRDGATNLKAEER